jgi:hypothetical protein
VRNANSPAGKCGLKVRGSSTARLSSLSVSDGTKATSAGVALNSAPLVPDVSNDLAEAAPVLDRELEVIEVYLNAVLEELFAARN